MARSWQEGSRIPRKEGEAPLAACGGGAGVRESPGGEVQGREVVQAGREVKDTCKKEASRRGCGGVAQIHMEKGDNEVPGRKEKRV